jgi:hypothetical protein
VAECLSRVGLVTGRQSINDRFTSMNETEMTEMTEPAEAASALPEGMLANPTRVRI